MKNIIITLILLFSSVCTNAQSFSLVHDHSTILVKNIDTSADFYKEILFLKELKTPWPDDTSIRFFETGDRQQLHIAQTDAFGDVKVNKVLHIAFAVQNFDEYLKYLDEKSIDYTNFNEESKQTQMRPDGVRQIYFKDPDGYWIEINDAEH